MTSDRQPPLPPSNSGHHRHLPKPSFFYCFEHQSCWRPLPGCCRHRSNRHAMVIATSPDVCSRQNCCRQPSDIFQTWTSPVKFCWRAISFSITSPPPLALPRRVLLIGTLAIDCRHNFVAYLPVSSVWYINEDIFIIYNFN